MTLQGQFFRRPPIKQELDNGYFQAHKPLDTRNARNAPRFLPQLTRLLSRDEASELDSKDVVDAPGPGVVAELVVFLGLLDEGASEDLCLTLKSFGERLEGLEELKGLHAFEGACREGRWGIQKLARELVGRLGAG